MGRISGAGVKQGLKAFGQNSVLVVDEKSRVRSRKRVFFEEIPIDNIAVALVCTRPVDSWANLRGSCSGYAQIINEIIQGLIIDRVGNRLR